MSRIGNNPIAIPEGVTVSIQPDKITIKGKLGELCKTMIQSRLEAKTRAI